MRITVVAALLVLTVVTPLSARAADAASAVDATAPYVVLITGANRGIGYEMARQYAERGWRVIATAREPRKAEALRTLAAERDNVSIEKLDVTSDRSVRALATRYRELPVDVLINNAGILGELEPQKLGQFGFDTFDAVMDVNVEGPLRMVEAFVDNVASSRQKKIMTISSAMGSIGMNFGGQLFYRSSKAALNMSMRTLSRELQRSENPGRRAIVFGLIDPGVVDTGFAANVPVPMITPRASAELCVAVIENFPAGRSGTFVNNKGDALPW